MQLSIINYKDLNSRQKENFNFLKLSAVLADFGFMTLRLTDDWQSADFIAQHIDGETFLKVQLKGRLSFDKKYLNKDLYIGFCYGDEWYLYPHDELLMEVLAESSIGSTVSWRDRGGYSFPRIPKTLLALLEKHKIPRLGSA